MGKKLHESVTMTEVVNARARANLCIVHLLHAKRFALEANHIESSNVGADVGTFIDELQAKVMATVLSSACAFEAFVNEVRFDAIHNLPGQRPEAIEDAWRPVARHSPLDRLKALVTLTAGPSLKLGDSVVQPVKALILFRNALVHFQPAWSDESEQHDKLEELLDKYFAAATWFDGEVVFPRRFMNYNCAKWSIECVCKLMVKCMETYQWSPDTMRVAEELLTPPLP